MIIYIIKNYINERVYIGQTTKDDLEDRIKMYKNEYYFAKRTRPIISAMRKYGFDNFLF